MAGANEDQVHDWANISRAVNGLASAKSSMSAHYSFLGNVQVPVRPLLQPQNSSMVINQRQNIRTDRIVVGANGVGVSKIGNEHTLIYNHQLKPNKVTDVVDLRNQLAEHQTAMNNIIEKEGIVGLQTRIKNYRSDPSIEAEGRAFAKAFGSADKGNAWLHVPDMATGGLPFDIIGQGLSRNNSILGGNATRIGNEILLLPPTTRSVLLELNLKHH